MHNPSKLLLFIAWHYKTTFLPKFKKALQSKNFEKLVDNSFYKIIIIIYQL